MEAEGSEPGAFCPWCGTPLQAAWAFCPRCGRTTPEIAVPSEERDSRGARRPGRETESARSRVREARLLLDRYDVQGARGLLDEAVALAPDDYGVRLARAEHFARLGLYPQALAELRLLRGLRAPDLNLMLCGQELYRTVSDRGRNAFTRNPVLPALPTWLQSLRLPFRRHAGTGESPLTQEV